MSVFDRLTGGPDPAQVREEMERLKEPERRKRAKAAAKEFDRTAWRGGRDGPSPRWRAAAIAWVGTATARTIASDFWRLGWQLGEDRELADDVYAVLAARGRSFFATLARGLLRSEVTWAWSLVRRSVREGLIEPPEGEEYVRGLVHGVVPHGAAIRELDATYRGLVADPALLEREVWQLFEVDAGAELSRANTWEEKEPGKPWDGYTTGDNRWLYALTRLADEGRLDRSRLLDASLEALTRDFRPSTIGWYAKLHEALEPTREERLARLDRYLALVAGTAPAVVKAGLVGIRAVEEAVPAEPLARVAQTPFSLRQKNLATETLALLTRLCKRRPEARAGLLEAAAHALGHERADIQERAVKLLEQYPDEAPRATLLAHVDAVSPTLHERVAALTGVATSEPASVAVIDLPDPRVPTPAPGEALERVHDIDELIELTAALLAGHGDGDDAERFLDGVSRLCAERPPRFVERTEGLVRQAGEPDSWRLHLSSGHDLVATVVRAWTRGRRPSATAPKPTLGGVLAHRALEVAERAARRRARPLLSFPSYAGGWIDPAALPARVPAKRFFGRDSADPYDSLGARLRTVRNVEMQLEPVVHKVGESTRLRVEWGPLPQELADLTELSQSLEKIGRSALSWWSEDPAWLADDSLGARWLLHVLPALPEIQYARALAAIVDGIDATVYRNPEVVLEYALDASVPLRDPGWDMVAAALLAKAPDLSRLGVDVVIGSVEDGRYDARRLGRGIARLLDNGVGTATRLALPLRDAARVSPLHGGQVLAALEAVLAHLTTQPHGLHAVLEVAAEGAAATGRGIADPRARATLDAVAASVSRASKLGKLARTLGAS